jgi:hypothetical protein
MLPGYREKRNVLSTGATTLNQLSRRLRATHLIPCQAATQTNTNPQIAPTNGRVNKVNAMIEQAATPTITTQRNTASSEIFIFPSFSRPSTAVKTKSG